MTIMGKLYITERQLALSNTFVFLKKLKIPSLVILQVVQCIICLFQLTPLCETDALWSNMCTVLNNNDSTYFGFVLYLMN